MHQQKAITSKAKNVPYENQQQELQCTIFGFGWVLRQMWQMSKSCWLIVSSRFIEIGFDFVIGKFSLSKSKI